MERFYTIWSLVIGFSAILVLLFGIVLGLFGIRFQLHEPIIAVTVIEILIGFSVVPFYIKHILMIKLK